MKHRKIRSWYSQLMISLAIVTTSYASNNFNEVKEEINNERQNRGYPYNVQDLPPELQDVIVSFLDVKEMVHSVQMVNKRFKDIIDGSTVWKSKIEEDFNLDLDKLKLFERSHEEAKNSISNYPLIKLVANACHYAVKPEEAAVNYALQLVYHHALNISEIGYRKEAYQFLKVSSKIDLIKEDHEARESAKKLKKLMSVATVLALPIFTLSNYLMMPLFSLEPTPEKIAVANTLSVLFFHRVGQSFASLYSFRQGALKWSPKATLTVLRQISKLSDDKIKKGDFIVSLTENQN